MCTEALKAKLKRIRKVFINSIAATGTNRTVSFERTTDLEATLKEANLYQTVLAIRKTAKSKLSLLLSRLVMIAKSYSVASELKTWAMLEVHTKRCTKHDWLFSEQVVTTEIMVRMVIVGNATIIAPSLSLRFASSEAATMTVAVIKYLVISQPIHNLKFKNRLPIGFCCGNIASELNRVSIMQLGEIEKLVLQHFWNVKERTKQVHKVLGLVRGNSLNTIQSTLDRLFKRAARALNKAVLLLFS